MEMGRKRLAVLVGCNYPGTESELHGCINDVVAMHEILVQRFGFVPSDIVVLTDAENSIIDQPEFPSGENIRSALSDMINHADVGDVLLFHFSGHGLLIDDVNNDGIYASDGNIVTDHDFRTIVNRLPKGASFTILSDSCHSGGLIDKEKEQIGEEVTDNSGGDNVTDGVDQVTDNSEIDQVTDNSEGGQVTDNSEGGQVTNNSNGSSHGHKRRHRKHNHKHQKPRGINHNEIVNHLRSLSGLDSENIGDHLVHLYGDAASPVFQDETVLETKVRLHPDNGILLSGCQNDELSSDVRWEVPHGAFTNALLCVLNEHENPISYEELVRSARSMISEQGFAQHPCLYSSDANRSAPFLFEGWN